jgi:hypothetical protein
MALSLQFARVTRFIRRHCMARPVGAAIIALGLGGAVAGGALAISPTVETTRVFRGGVNIIAHVNANDAALAYTVPAGRKFMLTDLVIANSSETSPAMAQFVFTGSNSSCTDETANRTGFLTVPTGDTLHLPFVTGIGFTASQHVCIFNADGADATDWTIRGYLFE